jgi:N-acetylmuramoyl-L-alanine amidase
MPNRYLANIKRVVLQAGHGQGDPGSVANGFTENAENNQIVARVARMLRYNNIETVVDPDLSLVNAINYVNQNHKFGEDWCIEIHKDSADGVDPASLKDRLGVYYYGGDPDSQAIATQMAQVFKNNGASSLCWARPDTAGRFGRLGWIRDTIPLSHLIECGFIQAGVSDGDDERYAKWVAQAICDALGKGFKYDLDQPAPTPTNPNQASKPWANYLDFEKLPNAQYYINSYQNNDWTRILGDIYDRDREIYYNKITLAQNAQRITDLENQLKIAQSQIPAQNPPANPTNSDLTSFLNNYDYTGLPFDITQAVGTNNLTFVLDRFKGVNSNYSNLQSRDQILKSQAELIRDKAQALVSGF